MQIILSILLCCSFLAISCTEDVHERIQAKGDTSIQLTKQPLRLRDDTLLMPLTTNTAWFFDIAYQDIGTGTFLNP